jgi:hypothetical protein
LPPAGIRSACWRGVSNRVARGLLGGGCVALGGLDWRSCRTRPASAKIALATIGTDSSVINGSATPSSGN